MGDVAEFRGDAEAALDLVGSDPRRALQRADAVLAAMGGGGRGAAGRATADARALAQRAAGIALRELGDLPGAEARLRASSRAAVDPGLRAEARMSLATVLLQQGRTAAALRQLAAAEEGVMGTHLARVRAQRALVLQRCGRPDEARELYGRALPVLRRSGDALAEARVRNNRGLLLAYTGDLRGAAADLERSRELYSSLGHAQRAADSEWNLGFVAMLDGRFAETLERYDGVEQVYLELGMPLGRLLLDRADVLTTLGLVGEAATTVERAVDELRTADDRVDLAEGLLLGGEVDLARGRTAEASDAAREAAGMFVRQRRTGWELRARMLALRAEAAAGTARPATALRLADRLATAGWGGQAIDARLVAAALYLQHGRVTSAREVVRLARVSARHPDAGLRMRAQYASALERTASGDDTAALTAVRRGLDVLEGQREVLGATELRVNLSGWGEQVGALGVRLALRSGSPRVVLEMADRWRAGTLRTPPVTPPADSGLAEALADLRRAYVESAERRLSGEAGSSAELTRAEQRVRRLTRTLRREGATETLVCRLPELVALLAGRDYLQYVISDAELWSVHVDSRGRASLRAHGPVGPVRLEVDTVHFALRRTASGGGERTLAALEAASKRLDDLLLGAIPDLGDEVVVSPTGFLTGLPWAALPSLRERAVAVAPSGVVWQRAAQRPATRVGGVLLAAGPGLPAASREVRALARGYPHATVLTGRNATVTAVQQAMHGTALVHIACHGTLRPDNPLFSCLHLADGPMTIYDLEQVLGAPELVVLPACVTAADAQRTGDEVIGLGSALLGLGARAVVAPVAQVGDDAADAYSRRLHRQLRRGRSPAAALTAARDDTQPDPAARASELAFVCLGAG